MKILLNSSSNSKTASRVHFSTGQSSPIKVKNCHRKRHFVLNFKQFIGQQKKAMPDILCNNGYELITLTKQNTNTIVINNELISLNDTISKLCRFLMEKPRNLKQLIKRIDQSQRKEIN